MNTKALRQKVLDLAIHGKLVPQNPNDESVTVLLEKIRAEKAEKIKKGELKADKKDSFIFVGSDKRHYEQFADGTVKDIENEIPFEVPAGWAVARMGTYITFTGGAQPPKETFEYSPNEDNIRLIQIRDYKTDAYTTYIPKKLARRFCSKTDVMIGRYGPPLFQILRGIEGAYNVAIMKAEAVPEIMQNDYLYYMLQDGTLLHFLESLSDRTCGQDGVNMFELNNYLILIPPYDEQRRIIKKLEETFPIIESLKENISDLTAAIKQAKSKILDLAIHGKLVPQDPNDEPAEELLKRIATSDNRPYKKFDDEEPFDIPDSWAWCRLKDICTVFGRIGFRGYTRDDLVEKGNGAITLSPSNLTNMKLDLTECTYISWPKYEESPEIQLDIDDVVIVKTGSSYGKSSLVDKLIEKTTLNPQLMVLKNRKCNSKYLCYFLNTLYMRKHFEDLVNGTAIPTFSQEKFSIKDFPLPPSSEQKRIVSKIEELFSYLDIISSNLE